MTLLQKMQLPAGHGFSTPLVLDLSDQGILTVTMAAGASFDINATGTAINTGWIAKGEGFLVEANANGTVTNGSQLFGSATPLANGGNAPDGFAALQTLDADHDGAINAKDPGFSHLQVWENTANGMQLFTLRQLGIVQLNLEHTSSASENNGNIIGLVGSYETADGKTHAMSDVWLQTGNLQNATVDLSALNPANVSAGSLSQITLASGELLKLNAVTVGQYGGLDVIGNGQTGAGHVQMLVTGGTSNTVEITDLQTQWVDEGSTVVNGIHYEIYQANHGVELLAQSQVHIVFG